MAVLDEFPADTRMQDIAREMSLAETAFVVPRADGAYDLRWFTPTIEVDLCGHATLAAAHVLGGTCLFHTRSGILECFGTDDGWIEMDFPIDIPYVVEWPEWFNLTDIHWFGRGKFDHLIELASADAVRKFRPDLDMISQLGSRSMILTAFADRPGIDCVSRVFGPNVGIPEDSVTGSAHCTLAAFWGPRLGSDRLIGEQSSPRGGIIRMRRQGDRVILGGQAITVSRIELLV